MNGMPSVAVKYDGSSGTCYAAIAYDEFFGNDYIKSRLDIVDITDETDPVIVKSWISTDPDFEWNQYLSYVTINEFTNNIGWFWISDNQGPCSVGIEGAVDTDLGLSNMSATGKLDETFPAIIFGSPSGIDDYNAGVTGGTEDGALYAVWAAAVCVSAPGFPCDVPGDDCEEWNLAAKIVRVVPTLRIGRSSIPELRPLEWNR